MGENSTLRKHFLNDADGDGDISRQEFMDVMQSMGVDLERYELYALQVSRSKRRWARFVQRVCVSRTIIGESLSAS